MNPIELPNPAPFNSKVFDLRYRQIVTGTEGGFVQTIQRGTPVWYAEYQTPALRLDREITMQSFVDKLRGSLNTFIGYDPRRPRPLAYINGGSWGTPRLTGTNLSNNLLIMDQWIVGAILTAGDYISYKIGNRWYLHRCVSNAVADSSGIISVEVVPKPPTFVSIVNLRIEKAGCEMKLIEAPDVKDEIATGKSFSLKAVQYMERS